MTRAAPAATDVTRLAEIEAARYRPAIRLTKRSASAPRLTQIRSGWSEGSIARLMFARISGKLQWYDLRSGQ